MSDWYYEPDECVCEEEIIVDNREWEDGCVTINCPKCKAELTQDMDHFEIL